MPIKKNFISNLSASFLQLAINQGLGLVIFYILSKQLDKATFGNLNWALAVLLVIFNLLSFGIDQLTIKKIAKGENAPVALSLFVSHVVLSSVLLYGLLGCAYLLFSGFFKQHPFLFLLSLAKLCYFFSLPFKQLCQGLEKFTALLYMSIGANIFKAIAFVLFLLVNTFTIDNILLIYVLADFFELLISIIIGTRFIGAKKIVKIKVIQYVELLKEAALQFGTIFFAAGIARADWVLIGIFLSSVKLAEYSFAYKAFEVMSTPLLVLAPVIIPVFVRIFHSKEPPPGKIKKIKRLLEAEMAIAAATAMLLVLMWSPIIDYITGNKYGHVNSETILLLAAAIPLLYFTNFLWTIHFSLSNGKFIVRAFAITFLINVLGDLILIPLYKNEGAAAGYLIALMAQSILFLKETTITGLENLLRPLIVSYFSAFVSGIGAFYLFTSCPFRGSGALFFYILCLGIFYKDRIPPNIFSTMFTTRQA